MDDERIRLRSQVYRLIPSRYPPVSLFDWADSAEELEQIAQLEGLTNDRIQSEYGNINLVPNEDWIGGRGSTVLMSAFTHPGISRFSDGSYGVYYAADSVDVAIAETKFHRERFLQASSESPCIVQMRAYVAKIRKPLVNLINAKYEKYLNPDLSTYPEAQAFARELRFSHEWGLIYPSVRYQTGRCIAVFRPPALTLPIQSGHYDYVWNGECIAEIRKSIVLSGF